MKKSGLIIAMLVAAVLLCSAATVVADEIKSTVSVIRHGGVSFSFDGVIKVLPSDMTVLMYNDRVYVPARFVAEELGAEVDWDSERERVIILSPTAEPVTTTAAPVTSTPTPPGVIATPDRHFFQRLPLKLVEKNISIQIFQIDTMYNYRVSVMLELENRSQGTLFYSFADAYIVVDGEKIMAVETGFNYYSIGLAPTESVTAEIRFEKEIKDVTDIKLVLPFEYQDSQRNESPMEFMFYIDASDVN